MTEIVKLLFNQLSLMGTACLCSFLNMYCSLCFHLPHTFFLIIIRWKRFIQHVLWWLSIWRLESNAVTLKDKRPATATISLVSSPIWTIIILITLHLFMSLMSVHLLIGNRTFFEVGMILRDSWWAWFSDWECFWLTGEV